MTFHVLLSFFAALLCGVLALVIFLQEQRSFVHRIFALGMVILALIEAFSGMKVYSSTLQQFLYWERLELISESFFPGVWLIFSLSFGRSNYKELLKKWRWITSASFIPLIFLLLFFSHRFFKTPLGVEGSTVVLFPLSWAGYFFFLTSLLVFVAILVNLEGTLRSSVGIKRWKIKFMVLGVGSLFAVQIYTTSQTLLYSSLNLNVAFLNTYATIITGILIIFSAIRNRLLDVDIHVSGEFLFNSLTVLGVGIYLLVVGVLAKLVSQFPENKVLSLSIFFVFLSLIILALVLMSDRLRQEFKRFIYQNFYRSQYDYRKQWAEFTKGTTFKVNVKDLCFAVTKLVSDTYGVPSVTIWLIEEPQDQIVLGGSTVFSDIKALDSKLFKKDFESLLTLMRTKQTPIDFHSPYDQQIQEMKKRHSEFLREARIRYCICLFAGQELLGMMTLHNRLTKQPFSMEDFDLLKVIADQTAGSLLNLKLSQNLIKAKELEAFQSLSAFFIHDLKNLASTLSLTIKNLPYHYEDPEFRQDALKVVSKSVEKMNGMCSRLSLLTKKLELCRIETDLNELVLQTINEIQGSLKCDVVKDLLPIPQLLIDPNQMRKVLMNLVLNANEAFADQSGKIQIKTEPIEGEKVCLSVKDNGCGISEEFLASSLFQPFHTTKSQGLGIGLYHSKMIVEAHYGKIEVESQKGTGTTFKVILPIKIKEFNS